VKIADLKVGQRVRFTEGGACCSEKETGLPHPPHVGRCGLPTGRLGVVSCYCTRTTTLREGIVRSFQFAEWHDDGLVLLDIDPPLRGPISGSIRRIDPDRIIEVVGAVKS
jgi:hypothetical protein